MGAARGVELPRERFLLRCSTPVPGSSFFVQGPSVVLGPGVFFVFLVAEIGAGLLVEPKMNSSVGARVADIVRDLVEPGVVEGHPRHGGIAIVMAWPPAP
jgi:hypothetical protein